MIKKLPIIKKINWAFLLSTYCLYIHASSPLSLKELAAIQLVCETIKPLAHYSDEKAQCLSKKLTNTRLKHYDTKKRRYAQQKNIYNLEQQLMTHYAQARETQLKDILSVGIHTIYDTLKKTYINQLPQELIDFCNITFFRTHILKLPAAYDNETNECNLKILFLYLINRLYYITPANKTSASCICYFGNSHHKTYIHSYSDIATHIEKENKEIDINLIGTYEWDGTLAKNIFFRWPNCFHLLPNVQFLSFTKGFLCSFSTLPTELGYLKKLTKLTFTHNNIKRIDSRIFNSLTLLEELNLSHNELRELPNTIGSLHNLTVLNLAYNKIKTVPLSLFSLEKLSKIYLDYHSLFNDLNRWKKSQLNEFHIYKNKNKRNKHRDLPQAIQAFARSRSIFIHNKKKRLRKKTN